MKTCLSIASAIALALTASNTYAGGDPLREVSASVSSLTFDMPGTPPMKWDGAQTMAAAMSVGVAQMFDMVRNGVTPEGGSCPPAPLAQCTNWLKSKSAMEHMFILYTGMTAPFGFAHSCREIGNFASKVYAVKNSRQALGDVLTVISSGSKGDRNKATLLQGVAIAVYGDGSLNRETAYESAYSACQTLPRQVSH
jgi:hypothetical protein